MDTLQELRMLEDFDADSYFAALLMIATTNGTISETELSFLKGQAHLLNFDLEQLLACTTRPNIEKLASSSVMTKRIILRDCISLANIDGNYDDSERKHVTEIAAQWGVGEDEIQNIEQWLEEYWAVMEKGKNLFCGKQA